MGLVKALRFLLRSGRAFSTDRTGGPAIEFALVGTSFLLLLFFVIQGGIYYLRVTALDYATEVVARTLELNGNSSSLISPTSSAAFAYDVAQNSFGVLDAANISVSLKECAPAGFSGSTSVAIPCSGGFGGMSTTPIDTSGNTYQYFNGTCTANIDETIADNGQQAVSVVSGTTNCVPGTATSNASGTALTSGPGTTCNTTSFNYYQQGAGNLIGNVGAGVLSLGPATKPLKAQGQATNPYTFSGGGHTFTTTEYDGALFTCSADQDFLVQVVYKDTTIVSLISSFFGPITSTVAAQFEPPLI
jgi:hypothetical protein